MDEDDDFGDLYAGLGGSDEAAAATPTAAPQQGGRNAGFVLEEEDDDDDELNSFANLNRKQESSARLEATAGAGSINEGAVNRDAFAEDERGGSESDSDDDLQIVLNNDNKREAAEIEPTVAGESKEDADEVLPAASTAQPWSVEDQQPIQSDVVPALPQSPMGLPPGLLPPGLLPEAARPGPPNVAAPPPRPPGRPFMVQHHAQFKYVRGPMAAGGPMMNSAGVLGRGSFPPGAWGPGKGPPSSGASRPWGGPPGFPHNEFHLPPTKSVFDMDLDALEEKPWRHPNADITDFFNFGFNEGTWRMYCQQLSQLRLESTMQTKISVYESGRSEQPIGRAIQVEGGVGERRPTIELRRNRNRDTNEVIEIVLRDVEVFTPTIGNDYDGTIHEQDDQSSRGGMMGRSGPYMDDGSFYPMGPRPRAPYRMFPGGPFGPGRGGVMRPPFYEPGMPPLPLHMRPEGFPVGFPSEFGDPPRSRTSGSMGTNKTSRGGEEEQSSGSVAVKDDRKHGDSSKDGRRSKGSREQVKEEEDEKSDEHKRSVSEDKQKGYSDARSRDEKDGRKKEPVSDVDRSSHSDEEDHKSRQRSRKEVVEGDDKHLKKSNERDRGQERLDKEQRKDDDWSKKSYRDRDELKWKEDEARSRLRGRDEDSSRRREDEGRKRERGDEDWRRKEKEESWKRDRDSDRDRDRGRDRDHRDESQKRRSGYDDSYDRRDRDEYERRDRDEYERRDRDEHERRDRDEDRSGHSDRSKRHGYEKAAAADQRDEDGYRRKSKHESSSQRKEHRDVRQYEDEYYEHRKSGSSRREHSVDRQKEDDRSIKEKYGWSRSKEGEGRRNGSTSEFVDDRKKRKTGEYQKSVHAEKVRDHAEESSEKKSRKASFRDDSYSSEGDEDDDGYRKGRSKMERLNRERPLDEENPNANATSVRYSRSSVKQEPAADLTTTTTSSKMKTNGDRQEFLESVARRKERFMKLESSERKASGSDKEKISQADTPTTTTTTTEFKHERPARKRRWGS